MSESVTSADARERKKSSLSHPPFSPHYPPQIMLLQESRVLLLSDSISPHLLFECLISRWVRQLFNILFELNNKPHATAYYYGHLLEFI